MAKTPKPSPNPYLSNQVPMHKRMAAGGKPNTADTSGPKTRP